MFKRKPGRPKKTLLSKVLKFFLQSIDRLMTYRW